MLTRMVSISGPRDPPTLASQSAGITGLSHHARPIGAILEEAYHRSQYWGKHTWQPRCGQVWWLHFSPWMFFLRFVNCNILKCARMTAQTLRGTIHPHLPRIFLVLTLKVLYLGKLLYPRHQNLYVEKCPCGPEGIYVKAWLPQQMVLVIITSILRFSTNYNFFQTRHMGISWVLDPSLICRCCSYVPGPVEVYLISLGQSC